MSDVVSLKTAIEMLLQVKMLSEQQMESWKELLDALNDEQTQKVWDVLIGENEGIELSLESLEEYKLYLRDKREQRVSLLQQLAEDTSLLPIVQKLVTPIVNFDEDKFEVIFNDEEEAAKFLVHLSIEELDGLASVFDAMYDQKTMKEDQHADLTTLIANVQDLRFEQEKEVAKELNLFSENIALTLKLELQLGKLKQIQQTA